MQGVSKVEDPFPMRCALKRGIPYPIDGGNIARLDDGEDTVVLTDGICSNPQKEGTQMNIPSKA